MFLVSDRKEAVEYKAAVRTDSVSSSKPSNWAPQKLTLQVWREETAKNAEVCLADISALGLPLYLASENRGEKFWWRVGLEKSASGYGS